jgi:hypothetical protein
MPIGPKQKSLADREQQEPDRQWRRPTDEEQSGGRWLVDRSIRILIERQWLDAIVVKYNQCNKDSTEYVQPDHIDVREANLECSEWELDSCQDLLEQIDCGPFFKGEYKGATKINHERLKIPHGKGCLVHRDQTVTGNFVDGLPHGRCTIHFHELRWTYEGEVTGGKIEGRGRLSYSDGTYEEGTFVNQKLVDGIFYLANGTEPPQYQTTRENETLRDIARKFGINENQLITTNNLIFGKRRFPHTKSSRLKKGTIIILEYVEGSSSTEVEQAFQNPENSIDELEKPLNEFFEGYKDSEIIVELLSRHEDDLATVRLLRKPSDLFLWASGFSGDKSRFHEEFYLANFDENRDLLHTFDEESVPVSNIGRKVTVLFSPNGESVPLVEENQFLCRFVWYPMLPKATIDSSASTYRRRPPWSRAWVVNAKDYKKNFMKILREHLISHPAARDNSDEEDTDIQTELIPASFSDKMSNDPAVATEQISPASGSCVAPLSKQVDIRPVLLRSNNDCDIHSDAFYNEFVLAFWKRRPHKGWWFCQLQDVSRHQNKRNFVVFVRSQTAQGIVINQSNLKFFTCICHLGGYHET